MARIELEAETRHVLGKKVRALRRQGVIPAKLYSPGTESVPLQIDGHALEQALSHIQGPTQVWLKVAGQTSTPVVIQEVQRDPRKGGILHVDFFRPS